MIPHNSNSLPTRDATAIALTEAGYPTSAKLSRRRQAEAAVLVSTGLVHVFSIVGEMRLFGLRAA